MRKELLLQEEMLWTITSLCRWAGRVVEEHHLIPGVVLQSWEAAALQGG